MIAMTIDPTFAATPRSLHSLDVETRTACVIVGATPADVGVMNESSSRSVSVQENRLGTLVTGKPGDLVIDYAAHFDGPVYDVMYNPRTNWFVVTIYRGLEPPERWDNRPGTNNGYTRVDSVLGAESPLEILRALDIDASTVGYAPA
jgi:hypothetical protein